VGAVKTAEYMARRRDLFAGLLALVVDDADPGRLTGNASWVLQTSPGKWQIGVFLDADDEDRLNQALVEAVIGRMVTDGLVGADRSGNNAVRYARLPEGTNTKRRPSGPWQHELTHWAPSVRLSLVDAGAVFGIDVDAVRRELAERPVRPEGLGDGQQLAKLDRAVANILAGKELHDSAMTLAASLVGSGVADGAVTNLIKTLHDHSRAPRDERFGARYADIGRAVSTAREKFARHRVAEAAAPAEGTRKNRLVRLADFVRDIGPTDWLIDGVISAKTTTMLFGQSGHGKSFIALDMALSIASGTAWHGKAVQGDGRSLVIYVAGEGFEGIKARALAWCREHNIDPEKVPLYISSSNMQFFDAEETAQAAEEITEICEMYPEHVLRLVTLDTMARTIGAGNENESRDFNAYLGNVEAACRRNRETTIQLVHHIGHSDADRARGSSAIRGVMDDQYKVALVGGLVSLTSVKRKDGSAPPPLQFRLRDVLVQEVEDGNDITSAVLERYDNPLDEVLVRARKCEPDGSVPRDAAIEEVTGAMVLRLCLDGWLPHQQLASELRIGVKSARNAVDRLGRMGIVEPDREDSRRKALTRNGYELARMAQLHLGHLGEGRVPALMQRWLAESEQNQERSDD
jgi:hypothetical protein